MQHAGLQYGQGAVNSHQSPTFADITQTGGNTTSSLRQFRKKEGLEKNSNTDLNNIDTSHIARVPPHNHYPARPNDYYRYPQYPDYSAPYKESPAQVKYSEIAETPLQNVDHLQKHKDIHMDMCNLQQMPASRQQNYASNPALQYHPESQYQQYPQLGKYNVPPTPQCRKYPTQENDFLAKLQRINPTMARSIMSDHHIRESQSTYPHHYQNQRYYPTHNPAYNYQYNYPSCNYRTNQMPVGGAQYPAQNDRSLSPRNLMMNYSNSQKISPNYGQYNPPEYAQHYQHRRTALTQEYYQQTCRSASYMGGHQITEANENRAGSGGLRHFIENWAEEEGPNEITPIFKENVRLHSNDTNNEQVFVINSSDLPPCLENFSLVPTENGQYIIKSGTLDNSIVRIKETENSVNLQIVEKNDSLLEEIAKTSEDTTVPYQENQTKDCDETTKNKSQSEEQPKANEEKEEESVETSVIVANEASVIKDMPLIDEDHHEEKKEETPPIEENDKDLLEESHVTTTTKRTQRIFSVDDIIGTFPTQTRRNSLQFPLKGEEESENSPNEENHSKEEENEEVELRDAISVEDNCVILEIGGALVQLNINHVNGTKILSVLPLSESLVIDVNGNYQEGIEEEIEEDLQCQNEVVIGEENEENEVSLEFNETEDDEKKHKPQKMKKNSEDEVITKKAEKEKSNLETEDCVNKVKKVEESVEKGKKKAPEMKKPEKKILCEEEELKKVEPTDDKKKIEDQIVEKLKKREEKKHEKNLVCDEQLKKTELNDEKNKIGDEVVEKLKKREEKKREKNLLCEEELKKTELNDEKNKIGDEVVEKLKKREEKKREKNLACEEELKKTLPNNEKKKFDYEVVEKLKKREEKKRDKKLCEEELKKTEPIEETKKIDEKKLTEENEENLKKREEENHEKKKRDDDIRQKKKHEDESNERKKRDKKLSEESELKKVEEREVRKKHEEGQEKKKRDRRSVSEEMKKREKKPNVEEESHIKKLNNEDIQSKNLDEDIVLKKNGKKAVIESDDSESEEIVDKKIEKQPKLCVIEEKEENTKKKINEESPVKDKKVDDKIREEILEECARLTEEMPQSGETLKKTEEIKEIEKPVTKAAKKLYVTDSSVKKPKEEKQKLSKLEETVNKIKSLKEKTAKKEEKKSPKKVTFNLETEIREISKEEIDRKKLSWEEYNKRKRKAPLASDEPKNKIMENTVTSSDDISETVVEKIENVVKTKKSPPRTNSNWEEDTPSPPTPTQISTTNRKLIIDVNEFNIKPIENVCTPSPVSSSQFSYHSEEDSLQVYKDVVDSKLNSLNIKIPKLSNKPKPVDKFTVLERFLNKASLNLNELEEVKKFIELKRKIIEDKDKDLKLHYKKVRKKKRFRNLYTEDTSDDSDSSRSEGVGDYSVYQRDSQGVPKLIFKRKSGLPQPFVKLERSQAVEMMAKKRKLY
ncbi:trichohyalin-like [Tribolium madens]|uniref:trichohyalin-like n=1 Tax=Tribolium madens TaxID=41895 RepID=UPI001CF74FE1|nr:trichohyalin-like [Tribolium madens]XP_044260561.1 trichohyalin-like [Tribolium madens]XP_044260562.1 trichohyalin-like [Tribolium madens]